MRPAEGHNSRHWSCFNEEDSIGVLKHVARHVSGAQSEQYLCKIARLRPLWMTKLWYNSCAFACSMHENILRSILHVGRCQLLKVAKKRMRRTGHVLQTWQLQTRCWILDYFCKNAIDFCCRIDMVAAWNRWWSDDVPEKWSESSCLVKVVSDRMVLVKLVPRVRRDNIHHYPARLGSSRT